MTALWLTGCGSGMSERRQQSDGADSAYRVFMRLEDEEKQRDICGYHF